MVVVTVVRGVDQVRRDDMCWRVVMSHSVSQTSRVDSNHPRNTYCMLVARLDRLFLLVLSDFLVDRQKAHYPPSVISEYLHPRA